MNRRETDRRPQLLLFLACFLLVACGGSSGGGGGTILVAEVSFPPEGSVVQDSSLLVSGSTPGGADSVSVAGVSATSTDGFQTWTALVPLVDRDNVLDVEVTMAGTTQIVAQRRVRFEPYVRHSFEWIDIGQDNGLMYLSRADDADYVFSLQRPNGSRKFFDAIPVGTAVPARGFCYDATQNLVSFSVDGQSLQVFDLLSQTQLGNYSFVMTAGESIRSLERDETTGDIFVSTHSTGVGAPTRLYRLAPLSGQATLIAGPFNFLTGGSLLDYLCHDPATQDLYAYCFSQDRIYRINASVGVLNTVSTGFQKMGKVNGLSLGSVPGCLQMVTDKGERIEVDIASGQSAMVPRVSCDSFYTNEPNTAPPYLGMSRDNAGAYVLQREDRIIRDFGDGTCEELLRAGRGLGPNLTTGALRFLAWDSLRKKLILSTGNDLYRLNSDDGDMELIPGPQLGYSFLPFSRPIRYDATNDRIYYISATTFQGPGGVYSMPATGGEEALDVPLAEGFSAIDADYDDVLGGYLVAIRTTPAGPPTSVKLRRTDSTGVTIADFSIMNSAVLDPYLFHVNAENAAFFGWRYVPGELVHMALPSFNRTPLLPYSQTLAQPLTMFYDQQRNELATVLENRLTITDVGTGQRRDVLLLPGLTYPNVRLDGITRDLESGLIYIGSREGILVVVEPETLESAILLF